MIQAISNGLRFVHFVAAQEPVGDLGNFEGLPSVTTNQLLILVAVTLLVIVTIAWQAISRRRRRDFDYDRPSRLFTDLCRVHKLSWANRRLLKHLAAARDLKCPATLFVEPEYFDMTNVPSTLKASAGELRSLRHILFD